MNGKFLDNQAFHSNLKHYRALRRDRRIVNGLWLMAALGCAAALVLSVAIRVGVIS